MNFKYQIYCDLDGVLCGFDEAVMKRVKSVFTEFYENGKHSLEKEIKNTEKQLKTMNIELDNIYYLPQKDKVPTKLRNLMFRLIANDISFWENLPWAPGGKELWDTIKNSEPIILTAPMDEASRIGKRRWVKKNLNLDDNRIIIEKDKFLYATNIDGETTILIDDTPSKIQSFINHGGQGILHDYQDVIYTLKCLDSYKIRN